MAAGQMQAKPSVARTTTKSAKQSNPSLYRVLVDMKGQKAAMLHSMQMATKSDVAPRATKAPRRSAADGVWFSRPLGTLVTATSDDGYGYYVNSIAVPPYYDLVFKNESTDKASTSWEMVGNNGIIDMNEYADENNDLQFGSLGFYDPQFDSQYGWYVPSYFQPQLTDGVVTYKFGEVNNSNYTGTRRSYLLCDSISMYAFMDERTCATNYGWGALNAPNCDSYLYGSGELTFKDGSVAKSMGVVQYFPAPVSSLYVEHISIDVYSATQPFANGAELTLSVYSVKETEEGEMTLGDELIAELKATEDDATLWWDDTSDYTNTGEVHGYNIAFHKSIVDEIGNVYDEPFAINQPFAIVLSGCENPDIDINIPASIEAKEDTNQPGVEMLLSDDDGVWHQSIYGGDPLSMPFRFYGGFDYIEAEETLYGEDGEAYSNLNILRVSEDGKTLSTEGADKDHDFGAAPVSNNFPWYDFEGMDNYYTEEDLPEWVLSYDVMEVKDEEGNRNGLTYITFECASLPADVTGRKAEIYFVGKGYKSAKPIVLLQGDVTYNPDDNPGEFKPFAFDGADGKYYLVNVATNKCWGAGNSWGTQASLVEHPEYVTLLKQPDGTYQLESQVSNGGTSYYFNGDFMDNGSPVNLTITATGIIGYSDDEETVPVYGYTIANGENYFGWDGETTVLGKNLAADSENALWVIATEEETIASLAEATEDEPVDATFLLLDPNFSRNNRNQSAWTGDDFGVGGDNTNFNAEKWGGNSQTFDISQTVNVPNGLYKISFNGFYRYNNTTDNTNDVAIAAHADGTEVINSFIYINGNDYPLTSIADEAASAALEGKLPFSQAEASAAFGQGLYAQTVTVIVNDGKLTVGIKKVNHPGCDWTVWDNFTLLYYGATENNPDEPALVAPEGWTSVVSNGNLAGNSAVNYIAKEYPSTEPVPANIVDGAGKNNSRGIVVKSQDKVNEAWDSQFWIKVNEKLPEGTKLHVEFDYKADNAGSVGTQSHGAPGAYQHWAAIGNVEFDVDWKHFSTDVTVEGAMADMESIAFNLNDVATANTYYFDNFGVWVQKPAPVEDWVNILKNSEMEDAVVKNFFSKEYPSEQILPAKIVDGVGVDGSRGIEVDAAAKVANDWDSQFWIYLPATLPQGTKYKVEFDYRADRNASADTQAHGEPGNYIFYDMIGSPSFTTEWQHFVKEGSISASQAVNADNSDITFRSIAFNLAKDSENAVKFFFDNVKFFVENAFVETGIVNVNNSNKNEDAIYNLRGQKVQQAQKGLYIINGKKVVK